MNTDEMQVKSRMVTDRKGNIAYEKIEEPIFPENRHSVLSDVDIIKLAEFFKNVEKPFCSIHEKLEIEIGCIRKELETTRIDFALIKGAVDNNKFIVGIVGGIIVTFLSVMWYQVDDRLKSIAKFSENTNAIDISSIKDRAEMRVQIGEMKDRLGYIERKEKIIP